MSKQETGAEIRLKEVGVLKFALAGLMLISVSRIHDYISFIALFRPGVLLFGFCILYVIISPRTVDFKNWTREWPSRMILAFLGVYFISSMVGISIGGSFTFLFEDFSRVLTFFFLLVAATRTVHDLRFFITMYVVSVLVLIFFTVTSGEVHSLDGYSRVGGTRMWDGNDLGVVFMVALPLAILMIRSGGHFARWIGIAALVGIPATITLTASRGSFIGLAVCGLALLFLSPSISVARRLATVGVAIAALLVFAPPGFWGQMSTIIAYEEDYNVTDDAGRIEIWKRGLGFVAERPILGVGPDNFQRRSWSGPTVTRGSFMTAHNTFIQIWAEMGTAGLFFFLGIIVRGPWSLVRLRPRLPTWWVNGTADERYLYLLSGYIPVAFMGFSASAFFVTHGYTAMFYILTAFLSSYLLLVRRQPRSGAPRPAPRAYYMRDSQSLFGKTSRAAN
jgi:putative inorganic carbon (hco3(-)) transporter